jgi:hypothetical protein
MATAMAVETLEKLPVGDLFPKAKSYIQFPFIPKSEL